MPVDTTCEESSTGDGQAEGGSRLSYVMNAVNNALYGSLRNYYHLYNNNNVYEKIKKTLVEKFREGFVENFVVKNI